MNSAWPCPLLELSCFHPVCERNSDVVSRSHYPMPKGAPFTGGRSPEDPKPSQKATRRGQAARSGARRERQQDGFGLAGDTDRRKARGADTARHVDRRRTSVAVPVVEAFGPPGGDVAVGDDGAVPGGAQLAAVCVAGQEQVRAVLGEVVQDALVRGMDDSDAQVVLRVLAPGAARPAGIAFPVKVRIIDAGEIEAHPVQYQGLVPVG